MSTIDYSINLGLAGDWVARVEYTFFPGRPATRWEPEDVADVSIDSISIRPDAPITKRGEQWIMLEGDLLGVLADELIGDDGFCEAVGEQEAERDRCAAEDYYASLREQELVR